MPARLIARRSLFACLLALFASTCQAAVVECSLNTDRSQFGSQLELAIDGDACAQFSVGFLFYTQQEYEQSRLWYASAAEQGVTRAAFELALLYRDQLLDDPGAERVRWMNMAAEQGLVHAQIELAIDYMENPGDSAERVRVMSWLEQAAQQGDVKAMYLLGWLYGNDASGVQDMASDDELGMHFSLADDKALYWTCQAAERDHADAQMSLSDAYSYGRGTRVSQVQRRLWLERAASNGSEEARQWLDTSDMAWYSRLERWVKWQLVDETARCPDEAMAAFSE